MKKFLFLLLITVCLTKTAAAEENQIGEINIPCINITLPFYHPIINDHTNRQAIIDNDNSALIVNWMNAYNILDHLFSNDSDGKGEWNMQKVFPGAYAFITIGNNKYMYECYLTGKTEYDGNEYINGRLLTPSSSYDIMLSCCAEDTEHHFVAVFRRLQELS